MDPLCLKGQRPVYSTSRTKEQMGKQSENNEKNNEQKKMNSTFNPFIHDIFIL